MIGKVLKPFKGSATFGVPKFLATWQQDCVKALRECPMSDRDSHHGDYLHDLVCEGYVMREELVAACCLYLKEQAYKGAKRPTQFGLADVLALALTDGYEDVAQSFSNHFDVLQDLMMLRSDTYWQFLCAALRAPNHKWHIWHIAKNHLETAEGFNFLLFERVYGAHAHVYVDKDLKHVREKFLCRLCKRIRRIRRIRSSETVYDADNLLSSLEFMLHFHFGLAWTKYSNGRDESLFAEVRRKTHNWLRAQNARVPLRA